MEAGKYYMTQRVHIPDLSLSEPPGELVKMQVLIRQVWVGPEIGGCQHCQSEIHTLKNRILPRPGLPSLGTGGIWGWMAVVGTVVGSLGG